MSPSIQKMITDVVYLISVVTEGTVRFLTRVDIVFQEYNDCLPNNK